MDIPIKVGLVKEVKLQVEKKDTAAAYGSGLIEVFATPAMIALMENASLQCVADKLPEGFNTVGTEVNVQHIKATLPGQTVTCTAELKEVDGRKLVFHVEACDEKGKIGFGTHTRFIIDNEKFLSKLK